MKEPKKLKKKQKRD